MPHTRAKTIGALEARHLADEKKIWDLEAHKIWASNLRKADEKKIRDLEANKFAHLENVAQEISELRDFHRDRASGIRQKHVQRFRAYKTYTLAIQKANFKRKCEDKARIAKLRLDVSEGERACVELADVKKKMAEMAEELQTLKTQLGIITEV